MEAIVVGGGLAGLAAGERLARGGASVVVLEASAEPGGVISTRCVDDEEGRTWSFESGPHSVPATATSFVAAVERLGLGGELVRSNAAARTRELLWRGELVELPSSPLRLLATPLVSWRTKLRFLTESTRRFVPPPGGDEPTLHELVAERFGEDAARRIAGAFVRGVYAGEAEVLGARSAFPRLWRGLLEHGSILGHLRALRRAGSGAVRGELLSLRDGLGALPTAFARALGARVVTSARVERLERLEQARGPRSSDSRSARWRVRVANGSHHEADVVVLAVPQRAAAELLAPILTSTDGADARRDLAAVQSNGVRLVHLGLEPPLPSNFVRGFGFLVPPDEARERGVEMLGTLVPSNVFAGRAPAGCASVACFYRLAGAIAAESPAATAERAKREFAAAIRARPGELQVAIEHTLDWPAAIPCYAPGHDRLVQRLFAASADEAPGLALAGSYTAGVSVDDVLERGVAAAEELLERFPASGGTARVRP